LGFEVFECVEGDGRADAVAEAVGEVGGEEDLAGDALLGLIERGGVAFDGGDGSGDSADHCA